MNRSDWEATAEQQKDAEWHRQERSEQLAAGEARAAYRRAANSSDPDAAAHEQPARETANRKPAVPRKARALRATTAAPVAAIAQPQASELDSQVEDLVRRYTSGAVIEAAWEAAHRIFQPPQKRGAA